MTTQECDPLANSWSTHNIVCQRITCEPAPNVTHATVMESGRDVTSQASYTCDLGYVMTSSTSTRTCGLDGNWTQEGIICDAAPCGIPPVPPGASLEGQSPIPSTTYDSGDNVTFTCQHGFDMVPASSSGQRDATGTMTCLTGNWTSFEVLCIPCKIPPNVLQSTWEVLVGSSAQVQYSCERGYRIPPGQTDTIDCDESTGAWDSSTRVSCDLVDCGDPPRVANGTFTASGTKYNDTATYTCDAGYRTADGDTERYFKISVAVSVVFALLE